MLRRCVAILVWCSFLIQFTSCYSTSTTVATPEEARVPTEERIIAVTTVSGQAVHFDGPASIARDTIFARVQGRAYHVALTDVERVWIERKSVNVPATIAAVIGVPLLIFTAVALVAIATKESCPFVYSWDGSRYVFDAEPYGGAVTRGLERDDYSELENLREDSGIYRLRVTNEVRETQYTNLFELWVVHHPKGTRVAVDEFGNLYTVNAQRRLTSATDGEGRDLTHWLQATDRRIWEPPPAEPDADARQEIVLTFPKPDGATSARLVANVATGLWGSHMIREMLELRGNEVEAWYAMIDGDVQARDSLFAWNLREELYTLKIFVEEPDGWAVRGLLPGGGPFIAEDRVVPLDVHNVQGNELRLRIQPPRGFWALNSFTVDYGPDVVVDVDTVTAVRAVDHRGEDIRGAIAGADDRYYAMPRTGDWADLEFPAPRARPDMDRTVLLHSRGYYQLHLAAQGTPQTEMLDRITEVAGAAAQLAAERYANREIARPQQQR